jgi:hypothetical protein
MQVAEARMERQLAAGLDLDALYGVSSADLAGMELGEDDDDSAEDAEGLERAAGADAELDAPPGMRLDALGGSEGELGGSGRLFASGSRAGVPADDAPEGFTSSKEARCCLLGDSLHAAAPSWHCMQGACRTAWCFRG